MVTDTERREVAQNLRLLSDSLRAGRRSRICLDDIRRAVFGHECPSLLTDRLADLMDPEPDKSDAKATAGGWTVKVYDPDGFLVSLSNLASDLARFMRDKEVGRDEAGASEA